MLASQFRHFCKGIKFIKNVIKISVLIRYKVIAKKNYNYYNETKFGKQWENIE